jgi:nucleotide-binding universal stress UspA family protein
MSELIQTIVAGVDGSANGERALEWAIAIAERFGAEVIAVHSVGLLARVGPGPTVPSSQHLRDLRARFENEWCHLLDSTKIRSRRLMLDGPTVEVLLRAAHDTDANVIVVGRRGAGGFPALILGSTSHQLTEHASCPVVVIPAPRAA